MDITRVSITDRAYPPLLRETFSPPLFLYVRGNVEALSSPNLFAAVGTRRITPYGAEVVERIVRPCAAAGLIIVSGLALGTDAACHEAALAADGCTIAVLAGGVDDASVTPPTHLNLAHRILESGGTLVSEHPSGMPSYKGWFINRNRIIAAMCRGTMIVEAPEKSGALYTADFANQAGRDVFAAPGPINAAMSAGPNRWLRDGALLAIEPEDVLVRYGITLAAAVAAGSRTADAPRTEAEKAVLNVLAGAPATTDFLVTATGLASREIAVALTALQLAGRVTERAGFYSKN